MARRTGVRPRPSVYGDDERVTYETVEHFPGATDLDPCRGYVMQYGRPWAHKMDPAIQPNPLGSTHRPN